MAARARQVEDAGDHTERELCAGIRTVSDAVGIAPERLSMVGFALRIASLRRAAPRESPRPVVLAATEIPIVLTEVALGTLAAFTLVAPLGLPRWAPIVAFFAVLAAVGGLGRLALRDPSGWWRGLAVLGERRGRARVAVFVVLAVSAQIARNWLMLHWRPCLRVRRDRGMAAGRSSVACG